jgi:hypothetical protein
MIGDEYAAIAAKSLSPLPGGEKAKVACGDRLENAEASALA